MRAELLIMGGQLSLRFLQGGMLSGTPHLAPVPVDDHVSVLLGQIAQGAFRVRAQRTQYPEKLFLFRPLPRAFATFISMVRRIRPTRDMIEVLRICPGYAGNDDGKNASGDSICHLVIPILDACAAFPRRSAWLHARKGRARHRLRSICHDSAALKTPLPVWQHGCVQRRGVRIGAKPAGNDGGGLIGENDIPA
ncbi:hypothetical protein [Paracoccus versutus]|uniref:hypothetical protein n=1 Tax=Paracoccus versutus TaxID=34007 RepID=UPI0011C03AA9|nr:hypothetical protein [Paracoccus versutus]